MKRLIYISAITISAITSPFQLVAQSSAEHISASQMLWFLVFTLVFVALICLMLSITIYFLIIKKRVAATSAAVQETSKPLFNWSRLTKKLTDAVPVEQEHTIDMGHDYDGIRELDNNLPPWWKYGFYISIAYAIGYIYYFHFSGSNWSSNMEYEQQVAKAEAQREEYLQKVANLVDENTVVIVEDAANLDNGQQIYMELCVACHGPEGQGGVGPNLTDAYWLHGGSVQDVFKTIKYGVPQKGMIAWQAQIKPKDMQDLTSFILTLQGTNPPNPKEAQGELYEPSEEDSTPSDSVINDIAMIRN